MTCANQTAVWWCGGKHQLLTTPCGPLCPEGRLLFAGPAQGLGGYCRPAAQVWECEGKLISKLEPCDRKCLSDFFCLDKRSGRCFLHDEAGLWTCDGECSRISQNWTYPCGGLCPNDKERNPKSFSFLQLPPSHHFGRLNTSNGPLCFSQRNNIVNSKELPNCKGARIPAELDCNRTVVVKDQEDCLEGRFCTDSCAREPGRGSGIFSGTWTCRATCTPYDRACHGNCDSFIDLPVTVTTPSGEITIQPNMRVNESLAPFVDVALAGQERGGIEPGVRMKNVRGSCVLHFDEADYLSLTLGYRVFGVQFGLGEREYGLLRPSDEAYKCGQKFVLWGESCEGRCRQGQVELGGVGEAGEPAGRWRGPGSARDELRQTLGCVGDIALRLGAGGLWTQRKTKTGL